MSLKRKWKGETVVLLFFYAQARAEVTCRWSGARAAQRVVEEGIPYSIAQARAKSAVALGNMPLWRRTGRA